MKTNILFLIAFLLFSVSGFGQVDYNSAKRNPSGSSGNTYNPGAGNNYQTNNRYQPGTATQQTGKTTNDYNNGSSQTNATPRPSGATYSEPRTISTGNPTTPRTQNPTTVYQKNDTPAVIKDPSQTQAPQASGPNLIYKPEKKASVPDSAIVLTKQTQPVIYYRNYRPLSHFKEVGAYGVHVGYSKDLASARKEIEKCKSKFKVAGFICEDWNLMSANNSDEFPYRLILGHYTRYNSALKLLQRVRYFLPCSFIVKYA